MSEEEKIQGFVGELRVLEAYYNELIARENAIARVTVDNRAAMEALRNLPQESGSELLLPIGGGVLIRVQHMSPDRFVLSLGADVAIEKTKEGVMTYLGERSKELESALSNLSAQKINLENQINSKREEINNLASKLRMG